MSKPVKLKEDPLINSKSASEAQSIIDEAIKKKGLRSGSIGSAISGIEYGILRTIYRNFSQPILKPEKIEQPLPPVEPVQPLVPVQPITLNYLDVLSEEERKDEVLSYRRALRKYNNAVNEYPQKMEDYYQKKSQYESDLLLYKKELAEYEYKLNIYNKDLDLYNDYIARLEINKRIEELYEKRTGVKWHTDSFKPTYYILMGMPGHGKTTAFREASKKIAEELGMRYVENPSIGTVIDYNTFVFSVVDLAGEVSKMNVSGLPAKESDGKNTYMTSLPPYRIAMLQRAGGAVLLLDDLTNASEFIQNIALPLTNEGMFNEVNVKNVYVGATCNLGALDGTNTSSMSSALRNRMKTIYVQDTLKDFSNRIQATFNDGLGDAYVAQFFNIYPHLFVPVLPKKDQMGGYTTPRSATNFIIEARKHIQDHGGRGVGETNKDCVEKIESDAESMLGIDVGSTFVTFFKTVISDADPLARKLMLNGEFNFTKGSKFEKLYGNSFSQEGKSFFHKYKAAIVNYSILAIRKGIKIETVFERLIEACMAVDTNDLGNLLDYFNSHFAISIKEYAMENPSTSTKYSLSEEYQIQLSEMFTEHPDFGSRGRELMVIIPQVLSRSGNQERQEAKRVRSS